MQDLVRKLEHLKENSDGAVSIQTSILLDAHDLYHQGSLTIDELVMIAQDIHDLEELKEMAGDHEDLHTLMKCCKLISAIL